MGHEDSSTKPTPRKRAIAAARDSVDMSRFTLLWFAGGLITTLLVVLLAAYLAI